MTTFQKKSNYFQLTHTNTNFFAYLNAKQNENILNFTSQLNNIRIRPLNLIRNVKISNIFDKKKVPLQVNNRNNIFVFTFIYLFLIKTLKQKQTLSIFLKDYFYFSKETLNVIWSFYLTNKIYTSTKLKHSLFNPNTFLIEKISELSFYQYNIVILNNQTLHKKSIGDIFNNKFWINISSKQHFQLTNNKKPVYNYLFNRNLINGLTFSNQKSVALNLNNTNNLLIQNVNNYLLYKPFKNYLQIPLNYVYTLMRLEEKIEEIRHLKNNENTLKKLTYFYNFLNTIILENNTKIITSKFILGQLDSLNKIKNIDIEFFIQKTLLNLTKKVKNEQKLKSFFGQLKQNFLEKNANTKRITNQGNINKLEHQGRLSSAYNFTQKKLELTSKYTKIVNNKKILSTILNQNTKIFYINALALTKFGFLLEKQTAANQNLTTNPNKFLNNLDREMISKYKYVGVYIKDLIRVAFIALFLKKPAFLAKFIAFQLNVLPKNRKETTFIRFIIKLVKTFAAEREEIWGLRLKFKGRVNRWRRTKVILGQRGILPLHTMHNRIEYGSAQGINRKGAVGVHIWIWYNPVFKSLLKNTYKKYFIYSKYLSYQKQQND